MTPGTSLGPYRILVPIGAGGMGEVYKAHDPRLGRDVAIKISKEQFTERFEREARAVAALNHPNISTLFDVGPNYLVMELIDGSPLKGPLPLDQAFRYAGQILDALDAAHRKGITHRDLKPANILITKAGVKLLDFGLAKMGAVVKADEALTGMAITGAREILGTLYYMAPEQLEGKGADARSDIFSFGLVLYEMLTGKRAFDGASPASVIAAILERPAPSISEVAPPALDQVLQQCLAKDPEDRWQSVRDLRSALILVQSPVMAAASPSRNKRPALWMAATWITTAIAVIVAALALRAAWRKPAPETPAPLRYSLEAPPDTSFALPFFGWAVSPDGRLLALSALKKGAAAPTLWLRKMDSLTSQELPGTENANGLFWSPDSRSIGFIDIAEEKLKRIDVAGGAPQTLCDAPGYEGGSWSGEGVILFGAAGAGLRRVAAAGGTPVQVTTATNFSHRYPHFLPDGRSFLYTVTGANANAAGVFVASLEKPSDAVRLVISDAKAVYAPPRNGLPGYLLWLRDQSLMAQHFDVESTRLEGNPVLVADSVATPTSASGRRAAYWISNTGLLLYRGAGSGGYQLIWANRDGKTEVITDTSADTQRIGDPTLSPDGRRIAMERQIAGTFDVWLYELSRRIMTRLTFDAGLDWFPVWSRDGQKVVFGGGKGGIRGIYLKATSGAGQEELLVAAGKGEAMRPLSWSRDGRYLLYSDGNPGEGGSNVHIWVLPIMGRPEDRKPFAYLNTQFRESHPQFSPDGKWVAYVSNESGRDEVYIQPFPLSGGKWQVSNNGGDQPRWRGDGKELFFLSAYNLWATGIRSAKDRVEIDPPRRLFDVAYFTGPDYVYDVTPDGQRFLIIQQSDANLIDRAPLTVVSDWQAGLKK